MTHVQPRPSPFLAEILDGFRDRGWDPRDLDRFRMEGEPPPPTPPAPPPPAPPNPTPPTPPTPDLAALQQAIDEAKATGTTEATTSLLKGLGFDKLDDLQTFVTTARDQAKAQMTEVERREAEAAEKERKANEATATAAAATFGANLQAFLVQCGVPPASLGDATVLVQAELGGKVDAKPEEVVAATAKVRTRQPGLFGETAPGAPSGVPPGGPPSPTPTDGYERGRKRGETERKAAAEKAPLFAGMSTIGTPNGT